MITPGYSPTATERVLPRMALDFTTASLDSRVTVTRALNTATRVNSLGFVETVNANLPRFDFDPISLTCKGLLIEELRANVILNSNDFSNGTWGPTNLNTSGTPAWINVGVAPDGASTADKLIANSTSGSHLIGTLVTPVIGTYTASAYVKADGYGFCALQMLFGGLNIFRAYNLTTGAITASAGTGTDATPVNAGNGWWRFAVTFTTLSTATDAFRVRVENAGTGANWSGNGTDGILVWGAQLEAGAFPTSYIPTTTTSLTRNADAVSMTGTNFSDWYNATEGTLQVIGSMNTASTSIFQTFAMIGDANNSLQIFNNLSASRFRGDIYSGGALQKAFTYTAAGAPASGTTYNIIVGMKANDFAMAINGNTVATANSGLMPVSPSALYIGSVNIGIQQIGGYIRKLAYYKQKLTNAEIQAFSK